MAYNNSPKEERNPSKPSSYNYVQRYSRQDAGKAAAGQGDPASGRKPAGQGRNTRGRPQKQGEGRSQVQNRWFRAVLMVLATLAGCVFLAFFVLQSALDMFGLNQEDHMVEVEVPKGATNADVASLLKKLGVVDQEFTFRVYSELKTKDKAFQPGKYIFNHNMGYNEIIVALRTGNNVKEERRITFIERSTISEIAALLEENNVCDAQEFIDYLNSAEFDYEFVGMLPGSSLRYHRLEGYIFPDTYDFYVGDSVKDVARKFLNNFRSKMTEELQAKMLDLNLTLDETITLASIIQREAGNVEDMRLVSSVFHNRLDNAGAYPKLQSDVTIFYVNNDIKPYLTRANQEMYDAYNTYICEGLPVGPICNPGLEAIEAALNPAQSDYCFFVTDKDGKFYYSETADQHYRNVAAAIAVGGEAHGIDTQD